MRPHRIALLLAAIAALGWALVADSGGRLPWLPNLTAAAATALVAYVYLRR